MTLRTFHPFPELARELQVLIWQFALAPPKRETLPMGFLDGVLAQRGSPLRPNSLYIAFIRFSTDMAEIEEHRDTQENMLQTCHLARYVALQAWKRDIERIRVMNIWYTTGLKWVKEGLLEELKDVIHLGEREDE